jgi:hypothetical protein
MGKNIGPHKEESFRRIRSRSCVRLESLTYEGIALAAEWRWE